MHVMQVVYDEAGNAIGVSSEGQVGGSCSGFLAQTMHIKYNLGRNQKEGINVGGRDKSRGSGGRKNSKTYDTRLQPESSHVWSGKGRGRRDEAICPGRQPGRFPGSESKMGSEKGLGEP